MSFVEARFRVFDGAQYALWSRKVFEQMRDGHVRAVIVTVAYHENFRDTVRLLVDWKRRLRDHADVIGLACNYAEMEAINASGRTAIFFALQNPSPIEAEIGLLEVLHCLGIRVMQLTYNNQSLLACGWTEEHDSGLTRMGREVIDEMNRLGMVVDMAHAGERSALEAIAYSDRPVVISHANPRSWSGSHRNLPESVMRALAEVSGLMGLSLYSGHQRFGAETSLQDFAEMAARLADMIGVEHIGIGSDLCQDQPPSTLRWMRQGRWRTPTREGADPSFEHCEWFRSNLDFVSVREGLRGVGFTPAELDGIFWGNWARLIDRVLPSQNIRAVAAKTEGMR